jgi:hypothetical protein
MIIIDYIIRFSNGLYRSYLGNSLRNNPVEEKPIQENEEEDEIPKLIPQEITEDKAIQEKEDEKETIIPSLTNPSEIPIEKPKEKPKMKKLIYKDYSTHDGKKITKLLCEICNLDKSLIKLDCQHILCDDCFETQKIYTKHSCIICASK